jgi:hypothetical protein
MGYDGGFGVTFNIGSAAISGSPSYTAIAQVRKFNGIEIELLMSDVTNHGSAAGFEETIPSGRKKIAPIELELAFDITNATHANASGGLIHALLNETKLAYQIIFPDASTTTWTFDAHVNKIKFDSPQEEHVMATVTMQPTGAMGIA